MGKLIDRQIHRFELYVNEQRRKMVARARKHMPGSSVSQILFEALRIALQFWEKQERPE